MDAYDVFNKIHEYWVQLIPKNSGEISKSKNKVRVVVNTEEGYREVIGVHVRDGMIELELDKE